MGVRPGTAKRPSRGVAAAAFVVEAAVSSRVKVRFCIVSGIADEFLEGERCRKKRWAYENVTGESGDSR